MQLAISLIITVFILQQAVLLGSAHVFDIPQTAINNGNFKTLVTALSAADLVAPLKGAGPFTVFAPTDAAFAKLPAGTIETLLKPENKARLAEILKYHVIPNVSLTSAKITRMPLAFPLKTLEGRGVRLGVSNGHVRVNNANVIIPDVLASNGVIHVIDTVLLPTNL